MKHHDPKHWVHLIEPISKRIEFFAVYYPELSETERYLLCAMIYAFDRDCAHARSKDALSIEYMDICKCANYIDAKHYNYNVTDEHGEWPCIEPSVRHMLSEIRVTYGYHEYGDF